MHAERKGQGVSHYGYWEGQKNCAPFLVAYQSCRMNSIAWRCHQNHIRILLEILLEKRMPQFQN